jgi:hypothetical protein
MLYSPNNLDIVHIEKERIDEQAIYVYLEKSLWIGGVNQRVMGNLEELNA